MKLSAFILVMVCAALASCDATETLNPPAAPPMRIAVADTGEFLPYGRSVPRHIILTKSPEPYNPFKHGAPVPNSTPKANLMNDPAYIGPRFGRHHFSPVSPVTNQLDRVNEARWRLNMSGINARNDAQTDIVLPFGDGALVYAPTHLPSPHSCIEVTTVHMRAWYGMVDQQGFWDWCTVRYPNNDPDYQYGWGNLETMSGAWLDKYTRLYAGYGGGPAEPSMYVDVHSETPGSIVGSCWVGLIYNFNTGLWEQKLRVCPPAGSTSALYARFNVRSGWTMWESEYRTTCPTLASIKASFLRKQRTDFGWDDFTAADVEYEHNGNCFESGIWSFVAPVPGEWQGRTPN